jgi:hypothetical protein
MAGDRVSAGRRLADVSPWAWPVVAIVLVAIAGQFGPVWAVAVAALLGLGVLTGLVLLLRNR